MTPHSGSEMPESTPRESQIATPGGISGTFRNGYRDWYRNDAPVRPPPSASAMRRQARDPPTKPNSALPVVAGAQAAQLRRESEPGVPGQAFAMRLAQRLWDAYVRQMRRAIPKVGRPCTICGHRNHRQIDVALAAGTSQRAVSKSFKVSRSALQRHHWPAICPRQWCNGCRA